MKDYQLSKQLFRYLAIYTMGTIFLPIVFLNLPVPFGRTYFAGILWLIMISLLYPKILRSRYILMVYLLFAILFLGSLTIWSERTLGPRAIEINFRWIFTEVFGVFISILMYIYFIYTEDYPGLALVSKTTLVFIVITSCSTILGIENYPSAVRLMASPDENANNLMLMKLGIGAYGFFASMIFIFPVLIFYLKKSSSKRTIKVFVVICLVLMFFSLIKSEFGTAIFLSAIFILFSFLVKDSIKRTNWLLIILTVFVLFILNNILADILHLIADNSKSKMLEFRLNDVAKVLELRDFDPSSTETYFARTRIKLSLLSIEKFLENPIIGGGWGGGHATWLDRMGMFGLVGFFPWIGIFIQQYKLNSLITSYTFRPFYLIAFYSFIVLGLLTTNANSYQATASFFFLVPGIYFISYLESDKITQLLLGNDDD